MNYDYEWRITNYEFSKRIKGQEKSKRKEDGKSGLGNPIKMPVDQALLFYK